jgi:hypothetical protein
MKKIEYTNYKKPSDFMSFVEGENKIRIVSSGVVGFQHVMKTANRFVNLGPCSENDSCEHCQKGYEPKMAWKWMLLDYADMKVKILDAGPMLGNQICEIASINGDPQDYDIIIVRVGQKLKTKYTTKKGEVSEISEEVKRSFKFAKKRLINKYLKNET